MLVVVLLLNEFIVWQEYKLLYIDVFFKIFVNLLGSIKKNWKNYVIVFLIILVLLSLVGFAGLMIDNNLSGRSLLSADYGYEMAYYDDSSYSLGSVRSDALEVDERKVRKSADIEIETNDYNASKLGVSNSVRAHGAIVLFERESRGYDDSRYVRYSIKVDSDKLDVFVSEIKSYGEVISLDMSSDDVTGAYVDYTNRLNRYASQMDKYNVMLSRETISIEEEIKLQSRIDELENQIFYLRGRVGSLQEDVDYSSVSLYMREEAKEPSIVDEVDFFSFKDLAGLFLSSLKYSILVVVVIVGFVIPFGVVYGIYRFVRRFFHE